jgi:hypothetical protein
VPEVDERLRARRDELLAELKSGEQMLAELDRRRGELRETMLRIEGALSVLTELIGEDAAEEAGAAAPPVAAVG